MHNSYGASRIVWRDVFYCKLIPKTFQLFPLKQIFTVLLSNKHLRHIGISEKESTDGFMHSARDAEGFKKIVYKNFPLLYEYNFGQMI